MSKDGKTDPDEANHKARIRQMLYQANMSAITVGRQLAKEMMRTIAAKRKRKGKKLDTEAERLEREAEHARTRSSRLVTRIYEDGRRKIRNDLSELMASDEGFTLNQAIDKLGEIFNANTNEPLSGYDIERIVRTETHSVLVESEHDNVAAEAEELEMEMVKIWMAAKFSLRTRPTHVEADGQRRAMDELFDVGNAKLRFPGDQEADAPGETINCFIPETEVEGAFIAGSRAFYQGPVRTLVTSRGYKLTVTPNHPILTRNGWKPARAINHGEYLFSDSRHIHSSMLGDPNNQNRPTSIKDAFEAIRANGRRIPCVTAALDFHGDAVRFNGDVDVYCLEPELLRNNNAACQQGSGEFVFPFPNSQQFIHCSFCPSSFNIQGIDTATPGRLGCGDLTGNGSSPGVFDALPFHALCIGPAAQFNAFTKQEARDHASVEPEFFRDLFHASAGSITPDPVVGILDDDFSGHVYDLQSVGGWLLSQHIVASNCRCVLAYEPAPPKQKKRKPK
jgi:hypothetical protein